MTMTGSMVSMMRNLIYVQAGVSDTLVISRNRVNNRTLLSEGSWGCLQPSSVYISLSQQRGTRLCSDKFQTFPSVRTTWPPFPSHESRHAQPHMLPHGIIFWLGSLLGDWEILLYRATLTQARGAGTESADQANCFLSRCYYAVQAKLQGQIILQMETASYTLYSIANSNSTYIYTLQYNRLIKQVQPLSN